MVQLTGVSPEYPANMGHECPSCHLHNRTMSGGGEGGGCLTDTDTARLSSTYIGGLCRDEAVGAQ